MRPNVLLIAKLSWLLLVVGGFWQTLLAPITPSVGLLQVIPGVNHWLSLAFWAGGFCLLLNRAVRIACVAVAGAVLLAPFESLTAWHPYAWVCGGVLLLCALEGMADQPRYIRGYMILVHGAALLGALDGAGWVTTALGEPWDEQDFLGVVPRWLDGLLPPDALARALYWGTIGICAAVPVGLLVRRLRRAAAALAVFFHVLLYLALGTKEVALFAGAVCIGQIAFLDWPRFVLVVWPRSCGWPLWLRVALDRYDFERRTDWPRPPDPDAELEAWFDLRPVAGAKAIANLVLCFPVFYFAVLLVFAAVHAVLPAFVAVPLNSGLALSLLGFSTYATLSSLQARLTKRPPPPVPEAPAPIPAEPTVVAEPASATDSEVTDITVEIDTPPPADR